MAYIKKAAQETINLQSRCFLMGLNNRTKRMRLQALQLPLCDFTTNRSVDTAPKGKQKIASVYTNCMATMFVWHGNNFPPNGLKETAINETCLILQGKKKGLKAFLFFVY